MCVVMIAKRVLPPQKCLHVPPHLIEALGLYSIYGILSLPGCVMSGNIELSVNSETNCFFDCLFVFLRIQTCRDTSVCSEVHTCINMFKITHILSFLLNFCPELISDAVKFMR